VFHPAAGEFGGRREGRVAGGDLVREVRESWFETLASVDPRVVEPRTLLAPRGERLTGVEPEIGVVERGGELVGVGRVERRCTVEVGIRGLEEAEEVLGKPEARLDEGIGEQELDERVGRATETGFDEDRWGTGLGSPCDPAVAGHPDRERVARVAFERVGSVRRDPLIGVGEWVESVDERAERFRDRGIECLEIALTVEDERVGRVFVANGRELAGEFPRLKHGYVSASATMTPTASSAETPTVPTTTFVA